MPENIAATSQSQNQPLQMLQKTAPQSYSVGVSMALRNATSTEVLS